MGQLCWQCDELIGDAVTVGEDLNREAGAAIVKIGDFVNPFVDLDHDEIDEAADNEDLGLTGDNIISDQFDSEPGGGFADITIGGTADTLGDLAGGALDMGGDVVGDASGAVADEVVDQLIDNPILLAIVALGVVYILGQLFDVDLGGSSA